MSLYSYLADKKFPRLPTILCKRREDLEEGLKSLLTTNLRQEEISRMSVRPGYQEYIPSVSPANEDARDIRTATPELMNVSPVVDYQDKLPQESIQDLLRKRDWLLSRKWQLEVQALSNNLERNSDIDDMTEDELKNLHKSLTEKLQEKTVIKDTQELILEMEHVRQCFISRLCDHPENNRELLKDFDEFTHLIDKVNQGSKTVCALRNDLDILRKQNFELKKKSRTTYEDIDKRKKEKEEEMKALATDEKGNSIQEQLESKLHENKYQRHMLQGLILGSGINWSLDDKILAMMINAGQNPPS